MTRFGSPPCIVAHDMDFKRITKAGMRDTSIAMACVWVPDFPAWRA